MSRTVPLEAFLAPLGTKLRATRRKAFEGDVANIAPVVLHLRASSKTERFCISDCWPCKRA